MTNESVTRIDSLSELEKEKGGSYLRWQGEIQMAEKELEKYKRSSRKIVKEFRADRKESDVADPSMERKFNLFTANTQILQTALLNQQPKPDVSREFGDPFDDVGRVAGYILERALLAHSRQNNFQLFHILSNVVQDNLVPGLGISWHTYKAEIEDGELPPTPEELARNPDAKPTKYSEVTSEELIDEYVYWEDLLWSPCRVWEECRWVARKVYMTKDKLIERFGKEKGEKVSLNYTPKKSENSVETKNQLFQQAVVYEIWDKESKTIIWWSTGFEDILDEKPDYLKLKNFWPFPRPLFATLSNGQLIPIPDYKYASDQYRELNDINTRISLLVRACRVAGVYDKASPQVSGLLNNAAENVLIPADQWAAFAEKGGMKGVIDWLPLEQIVATIAELLKAREDVKAQIYEVTGMSDIIRGASKASETLGAQKLKAQYASMRIQKRQKDVTIYVSGVFDIQGNLMRIHMAPEKIAELAQVQSMGEDQALIDGALQLLKSPEFELHCQVESDSLSDIDFQAEKQDRMEYMTTVTNFLKETGAMLVNDPIMGPFAAQLLQFSLAGFKVGKKFEGQLDKTLQQLQKKLAQPQPPQLSPEQQKVQGELQLMQQQGKQDAEKHAADLQFQKEKQTLDLQAKRQDVAVKVQGAHIDQKLQQEKAAQDAAIQQQKAAVTMTQAMQPPAPPAPHVPGRPQ